MALLSFKWLLPVLLSVFHPYYLSVTEINYNEKQTSIELSCKINMEDLQDVLKKNNKIVFDFSNKLTSQQENMLEQYLKNNLAVAVDGKSLALNFIGFEKESEAVYCYFEAEGISNIKKLDVQNSLLLDLTKEQVNIVHFLFKGNRKSVKMNSEIVRTSFTL